MNSFLRPNANSIFGIHDPKGLRYIFQLRVSLSPLRSHKFRHNFDDTPSDICRYKPLPIVLSDLYNAESNFSY